MGDIINVFPDYFSQNAVNDIRKYGKEENINVYRVSKYGKDTTLAFLNYYEEVIRGLKVVRDKEKQLKKYSLSIDALSVSCYYLKEDISYYFEITLKESYPERILLKGRTENKHGLAQRSSERKAWCTDSHTDWWLYKSATPWDEFVEVKENE